MDLHPAAIVSLGLCDLLSSGQERLDCLVEHAAIYQVKQLSSTIKCRCGRQGSEEEEGDQLNSAKRVRGGLPGELVKVMLRLDLATELHCGP
jgi:hypothetical protein